MSKGECLRCGEPVLEGEPSEMTVHLPESGGAEQRWQHWECMARAVLGSVGHQQGRCSCYGGTEEDPPGMTRRQAARAALDLAIAKAAASPEPERR